MKILCVGNSSIEITCPINGPIKEEENLRISEKYECGGGKAGNIAYLLGKWGVETYIASMLGADDDATKIKKEFETVGVKTDYIETAYDKGTGQIISLVNKMNKNKTLLEMSDKNYLKKYAYSTEPDIIVSDGYDRGGSLAAFDRYPKATSFLYVSDADNESIELCKYVKYIIFNRKSAELITNSKMDFNNSATLVNIYNGLKQRFSKAEIIITLGEKGSIYSINSQIKIMPTVRTEVVDTNGAGSTFVGAFVYATGRNFGLEKSLAYATIASSLSVTKYTSRLSIPSLGEVSNYYDSKFGSANNPNTANNQNNSNMVNMQTTDNNVNQSMVNSAEVNNNVNSQNS